MDYQNHSKPSIILKGCVFQIAVLVGSLILSTGLHAFTYESNVTFGSVVETTPISGFKGTDIVFPIPTSNHALYGLSTKERRDVPCQITFYTESTNDFKDTSSKSGNWCGADPGSTSLTAEYSGSGIEQPRLFVSGIRLCMNKKSRRLKGYQLAGKRISDGGLVQDIPVVSNTVTFLRGGGGAQKLPHVIGTPAFPVARRSNCSEDDWMKWASCSRPNQVATGAVVHISAGQSPRSITGINLRCQIVNYSRL
jgi:hypothetical protein